jgi:hypothetical protein
MGVESEIISILSLSVKMFYFGGQQGVQANMSNAPARIRYVEKVPVSCL